MAERTIDPRAYESRGCLSDGCFTMGEIPAPLKMAPDPLKKPITHGKRYKGMRTIVKSMR